MFSYFLVGRLTGPSNLKGRTPMLPPGATSQGARKRKHKRRPVWAQLGLVSCYTFEKLGWFFCGFE
jgi:hypothetical protein